MRDVELRKDGTLAVRTVEGEETVTVAHLADLLPFFLMPVHLEDGYRFKHLVDLVDKPDLGMLSSMVGTPLEPFVKEARAGRVRSESPPLHHLEIRNTCQGGSIQREVRGWGVRQEPYPGAWRDHPDVPRQEGIALDFTPLGELMELPIHYIPEIVFLDAAGDEAYRTHIEIRLIELLEAVWGELTIFGTLERRDAMWREIQRRMDEWDAGRAEAREAEDVFEELRRQLETGYNEGSDDR